MKNRILLLIALVVSLQTKSQIFTQRATNEFIMIVPGGVLSKFSTLNNFRDVALGPDALRTCTTCDSIVAMGNFALYFLTTGKSNVALGHAAMGYQVASSSNVAIGYEALLGGGTVLANNIGGFNVAIGTQALRENTTAQHNIAIGNKALYSQNFAFSGFKYSSHNIAIGNEALFSNNPTANFNGQKNIAIGDSALRQNLSGNLNIAIGRLALRNNTLGINNLGIGNAALFSNQLASLNTAIGDSSLYFHTEGIGNISIGKKSLYNQTNAARNTVIGNLSMFQNKSCSENVVIGNEALYQMNYSSSTTLPTYNVAIGKKALYTVNPNSTSTGIGNTALGYLSGLNHTTGNNCTFIGANAGVTPSSSFNNSMAIGSNAVVDASNKVVIGTATTNLIGGYAIFTNYSDRRLKENIHYGQKLGQNFINSLKTVNYTYLSDTKHTPRDGLIAQDVEQILNDLGIDFDVLVIDQNEKKTLNISYEMLVLPLINAMQDRQRKIVLLQEKLSFQKQQIQDFKASISKLEKL